MKIIKTSLFTRLFLYFFILVSIPLITFSIVNISYTNKTLIDKLKADVSNIGELQRISLKDIVEEYRHKTYEISKNEDIINLLENPELRNNNQFMSHIYNTMFDIMKGDTYTASAIVTSLDGNIKLSTHPFPEDYDLRNHSTIKDMASPMMTSKPYTYTKILTNNNLNKDEPIAISMIRYIFNKDNEVVGYALVDINKLKFNEVVESNTFTKSLLVDADSFVASQLNAANEFFPFNYFPALEIRDKNEFKEDIYYSNNYVLDLKRIGNTSFYVANYIRDDTFNESLKEIIIINFLAILIGLILSLIVAYFFTKDLTKPIHNLIKGMKRIENGDLILTIEENKIFEMQQLNDSFNKMVIQIINLLQTTKEFQQRTFEAERQALQSQINPHFLFNTLNTIKSLAKINNQQEIYTISIKLGELLRSSIYNSNQNCTLKESIQLIESYLTIQQIRFNDKLFVEYNIDNTLLNTITPKLILQPIVENAITHGLEPKMGQWHLLITIKKVDNNAVIEIYDNGVGFKDKKLMKDLTLLEKSEQVGLFNVYKRLQLFYKNQASLTFEDIKPSGTKATIKIPLSE